MGQFPNEWVSIKIKSSFGKDLQYQKFLWQQWKVRGSGSVISNESANQRFPAMGFGDVFDNGKSAGQQGSQITKNQVLINLYALCRQFCRNWTRNTFTKEAREARLNRVQCAAQALRSRFRQMTWQPRVVVGYSRSV